MTQSWFDPETGTFLLDEIVTSQESFQKIMQDQVVTDEELAEQARRVITQLKSVHDTLPPALREQVLNLMADMAVLYAVNNYRDNLCLWQTRS